MITLETGCTKTMSCHIDGLQSIAYDGCDYALLRHHREGITRLNEELCSLGTKRTTHGYCCITFTMQDCCYYACSEEEPDSIYILDLNYEEIEKVTLDVETHGIPCSLSMHPTCPTLLVLYPDVIVYVDMETHSITNVKCIDEYEQVFDIIALCEGYILSYKEQGQTIIEVHCSPCGDAKQFCIPQAYHYDAMILIEHGTTKEGACCYIVQLLVTHHQTHEQISKMLSITCATCMDEPTPSNLTCTGGKNEIIHSIALEEAGIAHILNAEGEKLQKAVASDTTIEELLMVNESVRRTIAQITLLEGQLYSKLESLTCLCDDEPCDEK